ncbi:MAG: hypothetical protein GX444_07515 [Myxococcales bacterium]|nr:hypothetical protein [Myxococcales bacterium]
MPKKMMVLFYILVVYAILTSNAFALSQSVRFCFRIDINLSDASNTEGDYIINNNPIVAYGINAKVSENGTGIDLFNGWTDADTGCTPYMTMSTLKSYYIRAYSISKSAESNYIKVHVGSGTGIYTKPLDLDFTPNGSGTCTYHWEHDPNQSDDFNEGNVLAVASFAIRRKPAGLAAKWFEFYDETCSGDPNDGACFKNGNIYIDDGGNIAQNAKTGITHEMGHAVGYFSNGNQGALHSYSDTGSNLVCASTDDGHNSHSREYQRAAAVEGIAHFYAAAVYNIQNEGDCTFRTEDCEIMADWLHNQCREPYDNRGVENDWLRFWWDVYNVFDLNVDDIFNIWNYANPNTWTDESVYYRFRNVAMNQGFNMATWDLLGMHNGVYEGTW